jgi:hypothetical protein
MLIRSFLPSLIPFMTIDAGGDSGGSSDQSSDQGGQQDQNDKQDQSQSDDKGLPKPGSDEFAQLSPATQAEIRKLRNENQNIRARAKTAEDSQAELLKKLAEALGLSKDGDKPDPDQLTAELTKAQEAQKRSDLAVKVLRLAPKAGANPDAMVESDSFMTTALALGSVPDAELIELIKSTVAEKSWMKAQTSATRSGGDMAGGQPPGEKKYATPADRLRAAYANSGNGTQT